VINLAVFDSGKYTKRNIMANLISVYDKTQQSYDIIDTDTGVYVVALDNKNVADNFVKNGVVTQESIMLAVRQDIATNGGPVSAPGAVQSFGSGPPDTRLLANNTVIYNTTDDPESQKVFAELRASRVPPPPLTVKPVVVTDPPDPAAAGAQSSQTTADSQTQNRFVYDSNGILVPADNPYNIQTRPEEIDRVASPPPATRSPAPVGGNFTEIYNPETGKWDVYNLNNPDRPVISGLSEQQAILNAQDLASGGTGYPPLALRGDSIGVAYDDDGFLLPGYTLDENNDPVYVGGDFVEPATAASADASRIEALKQQAQQQATVSAQRKAAGKAAGDGDWRVRLRLAPNATYLYKTPGLGSAGILEPLRNTDGVVFPYTPKIDMTYSAEYSPYDLVHSNYRGYFYKGSRVGEIVMNADFTAQDSGEADYLLAVIHFFRSATKMFYGQDKQRGTPPPLVFLSGLGEFQFNEHPCVISQFNYNLPSDVDYIRSRGRQSTSSGVTQGGNGLMFRRTLSSSTAPSYSLSSIWSRLTGANLPQGGMNIPPAPPNLGLNSPTYVPTKITLSLTLLPMPTRSQVSQQFSLEKFANGNALRGGFW